MAGVQVRVQCAFTSAPDSPVPMWEDITAYVRLADGITITRGRTDEQDTIQPARMSLTLKNRDGWFTWGYSGSPYYPNVKPRKRIRVQVIEDDGSQFTRFDGYVDGWPMSFARVIEQPMVRITATDRLARLGKARRLRDALHEELGRAVSSADGAWILDDPTYSVLDSTTILDGGMQWLYGLQEQSGSTTAGDVSGARGRPTLTATQIGTGGTVEFGSAGIMPEGTAVKFAPASAANGLVLTKATSPVTYVGTGFSFWCQFAWTGSTGVTLAQLGASPYTRVTLAATPTTVTATLTPAVGTPTTITKSVVTNDNRPHWVLLTADGTTAGLYVDTDLAGSGGAIPAGMGTARGLTIGGTTSADPHQVAWVGFANQPTNAFRAADLGLLATGGSELAGARIRRILRWLGATSAELFFLMPGQSQIAYQATGGAQALDLIAEVNKVENGRFFIGPDGSFQFFDRSFGGSYGFITAVEMSADQVWPDGYEVTVDTAGLVNDLTASRPSGATFRMRDEASIADYGEFSDSITLYAATDDSLRDATAARLARYSQPVPRIPSVSRDLIGVSWDFVRKIAMVVDLGGTLTITGLPAAATPGGATSVSLSIEGITEQIGPATHTFTWTTSPLWPSSWILDDPDLSILDSTTVLGY